MTRRRPKADRAAAPAASRRGRRVPAALTGIVLVAAGLVALVVSYNADERLPFRPTYVVHALVPDAVQLRAGDTVRIGGARVGVVRAVEAVRRPGGPVARITAAIYGGRRLPVDSTVTIRPLSILGKKALQFERGRAARDLPDGGTFPLAQSRPTVDLTQALSTFDGPTRRALRGTVSGVGTGLGGRGVALNRFLGATAPLLPPLTRVGANLADPRTGTARLIAAGDRFVRALAPVAPVVPDLLASGATTWAALSAPRARLGPLLDRLGPVEVDTTRTLAAARPVLRDAATLARGLRAGARELAPASRELRRVLVTARPALTATRALAPDAGRTADALVRILPPRATGLRDSLIGLRRTVLAVSELTGQALPAQEHCNALGVFLRNGTSVIAEGDAAGSWFSFIPVLSPMLLPTDADTENTHRNPFPIQDARGCAAGNTPFVPGRQTGNPATLTQAFEPSAPPAQARERARAAGLLEPVEGSRLP